MNLRERSTLLKNLFFLALISFLFLFPSFACKKNPIIPNAEELTRPVIWLDTTEVSFTAYESGGNPSTQVFKVKNSGKNTLSYSISDDADWLSVEPANGSSTGQLVEHTILINKTSLAAQDAGYQATITIVCAEAYNNPQRVSVGLNITKEPPPKIWVSPPEMTFAAKAGTNASRQTLRIKNTGQGTLNYAITSDVAWLNITPDSGSSRGEEKSHTVSVNSASLGEGSYSGTITVADTHATNSPQKVQATLNVTKELSPIISLSAMQLSFAATVGQNPSPQSFAVRNSGGGTMSYQITWDAGWLSVSPANDSSTGQDNSHTVSVSSAGLGAGTYNGRITVSSAAASNSPQHIIVTLSVTGTLTDNEIYITCNPSSGGTGTIVSISVSIKGNLNSISSFGLDLEFDNSLFEYQNTGQGALTGDWSLVDGNIAGPGKVTLGGFSGSGSTIPTGSVGSIAVVTLRVTGTGYSDGHISQITIRSYADDISGMRTDPYTITFTYRQ